MKKILKMLIACMMVFTILPTLTNVNAATTLKNPTIRDGVTTWDCIYFGNYYQSSSDTKEPIKWRILSVNGNDAFIMADKCLDLKQYNEVFGPRTWETCTLRSWLNGYDASMNIDEVDYSSDNFIDTAFTEEEQNAIKTTTVVNDDNPSYGIDGGNDTNDKIYLLSIAEVTNASYGFDTNFKADDRAREISSTTYCYVEYPNWLLRTPGKDNNYVTYVLNTGDGNYEGTEVYKEAAVCPVMHIDLSKANYTYAGTVRSDGKVAQSFTGNSSYTKVYGNAAFTLNAKAQTSLSYKSSNESVVTVSSEGKVTIKGVGKATITITADHTKEYAPATKKVTITVKPKGTTISSLTKASKAFTVKWYKRTTQTTGYQIQYSTSSKFTSAKTVTVTSYKTTSKKISSLKSKKKYYVRVRTYKTVSGTKYYSSWSGYKTVTTK